MRWSQWKFYESCGDGSRKIFWVAQTVHVCADLLLTSPTVSSVNPRPGSGYIPIDSLVQKACNVTVLRATATIATQMISSQGE
jgi:hypothetical protein